MNKLIVSLFAVVICILVAAVVMSSYSSTYDKAVSYESSIKRFDDGSRSELSNYTLKIQEMAQVPKMYTKNLQSVIQTYFQGKGTSNSNNMMSVLKQYIPNLDNKLYENLMITINAGRDSFNNIQKQKIDTCAEYEKFRNSFWTSKMLSAKFPSSDISKLCQVVSDSRTDTAFSTGQQSAIQLD